MGQTNVHFQAGVMEISVHILNGFWAHACGRKIKHLIMYGTLPPHFQAAMYRQ